LSYVNAATKLESLSQNDSSLLNKSESLTFDL